MEKNLEIALKAALKAGERILKVYSADFTVELKEDLSPLTLADLEAHRIISEILSATEYPVLSEEGKAINYETRSSWPYFWMVDPLDGTKEFVSRSGEFTVNIALIKNGQPVLGVIYVPVSDNLYYASENFGSFRCTAAGKKGVSEILSLGEKLPLKKEKFDFTVVASRSHLSAETKRFIEDLEKQHSEVKFISSGSSIKFCLVAEGSADIYPRFAPTMEWDTAAGQAICEQAGKKVVDHKTGLALNYNKKDLLNSWFIVQ